MHLFWSAIASCYFAVLVQSLETLLFLMTVKSVFRKQKIKLTVRATGVDARVTANHEK